MTTITVRADDLAHFRLMLRERIAGVAELCRDLAAGVDSQHEPGDVAKRLDFLWGPPTRSGAFAGTIRASPPPPERNTRPHP